MYKEDDINKLLEITSRAGAMMLKKWSRNL